MVELDGHVAVRVDRDMKRVVEREQVVPSARSHEAKVSGHPYQGEPGVPATGGVLSKIDPHTNRVVAAIKVGFRPDGIIVSRGLVWVAVAPR
jgi:DNA-binding beta-propeller fold protein YncE